MRLRLQKFEHLPRDSAVLASARRVQHSLVTIVCHVSEEWQSEGLHRDFCEKAEKRRSLHILYLPVESGYWAATEWLPFPFRRTISFLYFQCQ